MRKEYSLIFIFASLIFLVPFSAKTSESQSFNSTSYEFFHSEGVRNFYLGSYSEALRNFEMITKKAGNDQVSPGLICSAFLGEAFCFAYLEEGELALQSLDCFLENIDEFISLCSTNTKSADDRTVIFKNPHEMITPRQCVERVRGTVDAIERLVINSFGYHSEGYREFMKRVKILEEKAIECCSEVGNPSSHWTTCLTPLLQIFQSWKKEMPVNPYCY